MYDMLLEKTRALAVGQRSRLGGRYLSFSPVWCPTHVPDTTNQCSGEVVDNEVIWRQEVSKIKVTFVVVQESDAQRSQNQMDQPQSS